VAAKCNVGSNGGCGLGDFVAVRDAVSQSDGSLLQQVCEAAGGRP
jgi:hypothetical protein